MTHESSPSGFSAWLARVRYRLKPGHLRRALTTIETSPTLASENNARDLARLFPDDRRVALTLSRVLNSNNHFAASVEILNRLVSENPDWAEPWFDLGLRARDSQDVAILKPSAAKHAFETAVRLDPIRSCIRK